MGSYKVFDGTNWVDICDCNVYVQDATNNFTLLDPRNCPTSYWTGTEWCPVACPCNCPSGFTLNPTNGFCENGTTSFLCDVPNACSLGQIYNTFNTGGIFKIPIKLSANTCSISITMETYSYPDSFGILDINETVYYAQSGFYGGDHVTYGPSVPNTVQFYNTPSLGLSPFGGIYVYDTATGNFVPDTTTVQTMNILTNQFPITNTDPNSVPLSIDPGNPGNDIRTITWTKGATANDVTVMLRIVGNPDQPQTVFTVQNISCVSCP